MKLLKFEAKNIFSLGHISVSLRDRGLTLVTGYSEDEGSSNGAGKSSLANKGILWCLYGETAGGLRADAVLNRHGKRKGSACMTFEGVDGDEYRVTRERPAQLILEREGKDVSAKLAKDTQVMIDRALGIDFKTFVQTSFFGQGRNLSYPSLTPKEQKAVLEQILPMEEVDKWATYADAKFKVVSKLVEEAKNDESHANVGINILTTRLTAAITQAQAFHADTAGLIQSIERRMENIGEEFEDERLKLEILQKQIEKVNPDDINLKLKQMLEVSAHLVDKVIPAAEETLYTARSSQSQWQTRYEYLSKEYETLESATACPTCLRPFEDTDGVKQRIQHTNTLIEEAKNNLLLCGDAIKHYHKALSDAQRDAETSREAVMNLSQVLSSHEMAKAETAHLTERIANATKMLVREKEAAQNRVNPYDSTRAEIEHELTIAEMEKLNASTKVGSLLGEYEHLDYWRGVYSKELKLKLFEDACPFLDARTAYHMANLRNEQIHVEFTTIRRLATGKVKEEFNVNVWSETGGTGFDSLSGGEQQMVSFACGLALADLSSSISSGASGFLILDEPFSELDGRNSEAIVDYLTGSLGSGKSTVFLISNEETLKGLVSNRIHVVKSRGVSNVQEN
jgi:DNA repair exonuclease SbcCD ATPase subunit